MLTRKLWRAAVFVTTLAIAFSAQAELRDTLERIKPSIVALGLFKPLGSPQFTMRGTGFVVGDGNTVATNAHVVAGATADQEGTGLVAQVHSSNGESPLRRAKVLAIDQEHDLAVLRLEGQPLPKMSLRGMETVREGDSVAFTGFPIGAALGFFPVTHRGSISAIAPIVLPAANAQNLNVSVIRRAKSGAFKIYQMDATAYPGNSGSPVYDPETGEVIGVMNMVFIKSTREAALSQPSGIAYAIPADYLADLLRTIR